jgi:hypothetical protein
MELQLVKSNSCVLIAAGYTKWDYERNEDIVDKLKIKPLIDYVQNYQRKVKEHVNRMNTGKIPKQILYYQVRGQR